MDRDVANGCRFHPRAGVGHYESWFQRGNHPDRPLAFWVRYTIFAPSDDPGAAVGELWAVFFDGETGQNTTVKEVFSFADCLFSPSRLDVAVGDAVLRDGIMSGQARHGGHALAWDLRFTHPEPPLPIFKDRYYRPGMRLPKAKAVVSAPGAVWSGTLTVDDRAVDVGGWRGSQNHNWGSQHTDRYGWVQVAGFDDAPDAFLECGTGILAVGPVRSPPISVLVLRIEGEEYRMSGLRRGLLVARGRCAPYALSLTTRRRGVRIGVRARAAAERFVALPYDDPPGATKMCLNSKLATCELTLDRPGRPRRTLHSAHGAALEITADAAAWPHIPMVDLPRGRRSEI